MTLLELYVRIQETTGLEVITPQSLVTAISNCYADITSRGYKDFQIVEIPAEDVTVIGPGIITFDLPENFRTALYMKMETTYKITNVGRMFLTNPAILSKKDANTGITRTNFANVTSKSIYYIKQDTVTTTVDGVTTRTKTNKVYVEWQNTTENVIKITFGYYANLVSPIVLNNFDDMEAYTIQIRPEFENAVVQYCCYFYYQRHMKDPEMVSAFFNNFKYFVEDIIHTLNAEDMFQEEDAVIAVEL